MHDALRGPVAFYGNGSEPAPRGAFDVANSQSRVCVQDIRHFLRHWGRFPGCTEVKTHGERKKGREEKIKNQKRRNKQLKEKRKSILLPILHSFFFSLFSSFFPLFSLAFGFHLSSSIESPWPGRTSGCSAVLTEINQWNFQFLIYVLIFILRALSDWLTH